MKKTIVIGITGGIAAYKVADLTSRLKKKGYDIQVIMTKSAQEFITPLTLETLSNNKVLIDMFARDFVHDVEHISVAKKADLFVVVPASANTIAKLANGMAEDMLQTTFLACTCPKLICPAMNTAMYQNQITQDNITKLKSYNIDIVEPSCGLLACGDIGAGRLADLADIEERIEYHLVTDKPLKGKKVLVTAGATKELLDPVRFITNHSSGKMGYALAKEAFNMGAEVTLISGQTTLKKPCSINVIEVNSASDMYQAVIDNFKEADFIVKAAAVSDYTMFNPSTTKIKKSADVLEIELTKTKDILEYLGANKRTGQILCGFAMETDNLIENAKRKLISKNADMIVANDINDVNGGFKVDTNVATIITKDNQESLDCMSKNDLAKHILLKMIELEGKKCC